MKHERVLVLPNDRLTFFDSLKGYGILCIMCTHVFIYSKADLSSCPVFAKFITSGQLGVQLFIAISGYTLFMSLNRKATFSMMEFYCRRLVRIVPMYYLAILGWGVIQTCILKHTFSLGNMISHLTLLHSISPYWINSIMPGGWFVSTIFLCYLITPFLYKKIDGLVSVLMWFNCSLVLSLIVQIILIRFPLIDNAELWHNFIYTNLPAQLPVYILGIVAFHLVETHALHNTKGLKVQLLLTGFVVLAYGIGAIEIPSYIVASLSFIPIIYFLRNSSSRFIDNNLIRYVGKISYSIYLVHTLILLIIREILYRGFPDLLRIKFIAILLVGTLAVSIAVSTVTHRIVEQKITESLETILKRLYAST